MMSIGQGLEHSKAAFDGESDKLIRLSNVGLIFYDLEEYEEAKWRMEEAEVGYEREFGKEDPRTLAAMRNLAVTYKKTKQSREANNLSVQVMQIRKRVMQTREQVQRRVHLLTLGSIANLAPTYREEGHLWETKKLSRMIHLLREERTARGSRKER